MNALRFFLPLLLFLTGVFAWPTRQQVEQEFESWRHEFGVQFSNAFEFVHRLNVFEQNHFHIWLHNSNASNTYQLGHNQFSHLTNDEFRVRFTALTPHHLRFPRIAFYGADEVSAPASVDWVAKGAVTPVKDQGQCGSCWSFSATGALEGAAFIKTGSLVSLSEQQLIDCDQISAGCGGGLMDNAFKYAQHSGLASEAQYPYKAVEGTCAAPEKASAPLAPGLVRGVVDLPVADEVALANAVAAQPVSVAIQADQLAFQFYKSGVLTGECGHNLDHGVLLVGYGTDGGIPYWKIKNSWGEKWGEGGYIRIKKGVGKCGVADAASFPLL